MTAESSREPSRTAISSTTCVVCGAALRTSQQRYCTRACQQQAYRLRLRQHQPSRVDLVNIQAELKRRRHLTEQMVYECPTCETRSVGEQRCSDCNTFARALGVGGSCPDCDAVLLLTELIQQEGAPTPQPKRPKP
jgi:predicted nucleic acid-binding Zn ribbon protein